ncbi:MAG: glycine--tRNA ligase subunit beta [Cellvibrionaceae bacterium]|nr:glycine--tRNA ligase subunit beta [Cellvibrionaceae bacterium]
MSQDFLFEIGTEELPPKALLTLSTALAQHIETALSTAGIAFAKITPYATARRLAVWVGELAATTPVKDEVIWGPPVAIAFDNEGALTRAGLGFAAKNGVDAQALQTAHDGKQEKLVLRTQSGGEPVVDLLQDMVATALAQLPIAKRMRWGSNRTEFVRPVHWLVMLYGGDVVDAEVLGLRAGRHTRGHRFHCDRALSLDVAGDYAELLQKTAYVIADFDARKALIREQLAAEAANKGGTAVIDDALLNEVTALVEWPVAVTGRFDDAFLQVPAEALISSMKTHQKYFHLLDADGRLLPYFIAVANIASRDPAQVIQGNERVIRPRLADAAFFFETDKKTTLADKREQLKPIVFQAKLGSLYAKTQRIAQLAEAIARALGVDGEQPRRAGELCKADLVSEMVCEFADLQGIAGSYYAQHDNEPAALALAMREHYLPRFAGDDLPTTDTGAIVALADRLDTLVGIFGIGEQPTGSKDPFALRRASVGVLRLLLEQQRNIDLRALLTLAYQQYTSLPQGDAVIDQVLTYILERLRAWYEEQSVPAGIYQAVSAKQLTHPLDIDARVQAVRHFYQLPEADALAAANKRVANILSKVQHPIAAQVDTARLQDEAEKQLAEAIAVKQAEVIPLCERRDYQQALTLLASLRSAVDAFFDQVMVMTEDEALRNNRLALLQQLRALFLQVADISFLVKINSP